MPTAARGQDRERQYLRRLRDAAVPAASEDLTARLLARTEHLARLPRNESSGRDAVPDRGPGTGRRRHLSGVRLSSVRLLAGTATGGAAAAVTLLAGAAYLMGGDSGPAGGRGVTGIPDATRAETLTSGQLTHLRARGWTCPDLHEAGFHLIRARVAAVAGADVVELRLTDGQRFATILEQHPAPVPRSAGQPGAPYPQPPINILTGHAAAADGFAPATPAGFLAALPGGAANPDGRFWVNPEEPYRAIYQSATATITYIADASDGTSTGVGTGVTGAESGSSPASNAAEAVRTRMERGLGRLLELAAP